MGHPVLPDLRSIPVISVQESRFYKLKLLLLCVSLVNRFKVSISSVLYLFYRLLSLRVCGACRARWGLLELKLGERPLDVGLRGDGAA